MIPRFIPGCSSMTAPSAATGPFWRLVKLLGYMDTFLAEVVNLNETRLTLLNARVQAIAGALENNSVIGPLLLAHIAQGSWAHRTIIRPVEGRRL